MKNSKYKLDIVPGVVLAVFSLLYMANIPQIKVFEGLGSTPINNHFVPWLWSGAILVLSVWIIIRGLNKRRKFIAEGGKVEKFNLKAGIEKYWEVIASFIALTVYVALMDAVGFVIMTILYVFVQILILTPREEWKKNYVPAAITAAITGVVLFFIFKEALNVLLPVGILSVFGL